MELLKSINDILKKNEQFLIDNPEAFKLIEGRLQKAVYDPEDEMTDEDFYNQEDDSGISDLFDDVPKDDFDENLDGHIDDDEAAQWLKENEDNVKGEKDIDGDGDIDLSEKAKQKIAATDKKTDKNKVSSSGYREWAPKDKYEDNHQSAIDKYVNDGYSPREAERLAGASDSPNDFQSALKHKIKPSQPSKKMLERMKGLAGDWLRNAERKIGESADAKKNPIKHASSKALNAHENAHNDFNASYNKFLSSDDVKDLRGRARTNAIREFKKQYNNDNPTHRENVIQAANAGKEYDLAMNQRKKHLEEGKQSILDAGKSGGEMSTVGEYSNGASGDTNNMTAQGAAQMAGGAQEEGGYTSGTVKDPAMHFAESNPEYVKSLRDKLTSKLTPEQSNRLSAITSIRKKGSE